MVFGNYIADIETYCMNRMKNTDFSPSKLVFLFNVGSTESGDIFISGDTRPGNHFTIAVYDDDKENIVYGDSLGWKCPEKINIRLVGLVPGFCTRICHVNIYAGISNIYFIPGSYSSWATFDEKK